GGGVCGLAILTAAPGVCARAPVGAGPEIFTLNTSGARAHARGSESERPCLISTDSVFTR
ncbi:MAG: hypothetical protein AAGI30_06405, partial [Planctomycetota bacterium]